MDTMERKDLVAIIEAFPGISMAVSGGYEIPITKPCKNKGRIHIMFCSEGIEVHHDKVVTIFRKKKLNANRTTHRVIQKSTKAKEVHGRLTNLIRTAAPCVCDGRDASDRWWCDKHGNNGHLL